MADPVAPDLQTSALALLDPTTLAMIERGVPTLIASRDDKLQPSVAMAAGCVLDARTGEMTVFVSQRSAPRLLRDIASHGCIAVVCVEPRSHRAVQLKAQVVRSRPADASDAPALARYLASAEQELLQVGHSREFSRCILAQRESDLVALSFVPDQAFNQAPGPHAGLSLSDSPSSECRR